MEHEKMAPNLWSHCEKGSKMDILMVLQSRKKNSGPSTCLEQNYDNIRNLGQSTNNLHFVDLAQLFTTTTMQGVHTDAVLLLYTDIFLYIYT